MKGLMNHCGGRHTTRDELAKFTDPQPMSQTHVPIRHDYFVNEVENSLDAAGYKVVNEELSIQRFVNKKEGKLTQDNLFGIMEISNSDDHEDVGRIVGLRNSSTMQFRAQLGCGNRVFVCDNLSFSAEVVVGRRHTVHIKRDLPKLLAGAIETLNKQFAENERRVEVYKDTSLSRIQVHDIVMLAMRYGAIPPSLLRPWVSLYYNPTHDEFKGKNLWALQNGFTEVAKRWPFATMQERTRSAIKVMDRVASEIHGKNILNES